MMRIVVVALVAASVALTGCGSKTAAGLTPVAAVSSTDTGVSGRIHYDVGLFTDPASPDDSPTFSRAQVRDYLDQRPGKDSPATPGVPEVELRRVTQGDTASSLQWVIVWHHSRLTSRGPASPYPGDAAANCDMIAMLDAQTGGPTVQVQLCAPPPAAQALIDAGRMEPPLYTVTASPEPAPSAS